MKPGCMEIKYDLGAVSVTERAKLEDALKKTVVSFGFELLTAGGSIELQRDLLFVKNVKKTKRDANKDEHTANPAPVKKEKPVKKA